jgi:hypothetical protein
MHLMRRAHEKEKCLLEGIKFKDSYKVSADRENVTYSFRVAKKLLQTFDSLLMKTLSLWLPSGNLHLKYRK